MNLDKMKYISNTKIGRSIRNTVNRSLAIKTESTCKGFVSRDPTRENLAPSDENRLVEYAIDNDMIEYQKRVYNNCKYRSESPAKTGSNKVDANNILPTKSHASVGSYFTVVTCRNSQNSIRMALTSIIQQTRNPEYIVVVNDGSTDRTKDILDDMQKDWPYLFVITNPDLGYDISRVVRNWNAAIKLSRDGGLGETDYHMIATDDTIYPHDYAEKIITYMDSNPMVAVASGNYGRYKARAPIGAGRFIRNSFFERTIWHGYYPEQMGYESAILYEASLRDYFFIVIDEAKFEHIRPLGETHKFYEFGASMRTLGYHPVFAFARFLDCLMAGGSIGRMGGFYMLYYYLTYKPQYSGYNRMFHETLRSHVRANQLRRLKHIISKFDIRNITTRYGPSTRLISNINHTPSSGG